MTHTHTSPTSSPSPLLSPKEEADGVSRSPCCSPKAVSSSTEPDEKSGASLTLDEHKHEPQAAGVATVAHTILLTIETPSCKSVKMPCAPHEFVAEVRAYLLSLPETCEWTSFRLLLEHCYVNDYVELVHYPALMNSATAVLKMVVEPYTAKSARLHVEHTRALIANPPCQPNFVTFVSVEELKETRQKKKKKGKAINDVVPYEAAQLHEPLSLLNYQRHALPSTHTKRENMLSREPLLHALRYSGWHPPPSARKLRGDLLYLTADTVEGNVLHITCNFEGFFLNRSTSVLFDPHEAEFACKSSTLVELFNRCSPLFSSRLESALSRKINLHQLAHVDEFVKASSWLGNAAQIYKCDSSRSEHSIVPAFGIDLRLPKRDWNEEFQRSFEMHTLPEDPLKNEQTLHRVYAEFVAAAKEGAQGIVENSISPINALDQDRNHVYLHNEIFFSFALDTHERYHSGPAETEGSLTSEQCDYIAHKHASSDLKGISFFLRSSVDGLYNLASAVVDYCGSRVVCQASIPGIFHADRSSQHVYGSLEHGQIMKTQSEHGKDMVERLSAASRLTHSKPHAALDADGHEHSLVSAVDTKGIIGSDQRCYVLDLMRATPRDANWQEEEFSYAVLRPELVRRFARQRALDSIFPLGDSNKKETEQEKSDRLYQAVFKQQEKMAANGVQGNSSCDFAEQYFEQLYLVRFNNDVLVSRQYVHLPDSSKADLEDVKAAAAYLYDVVVPSFVHNLQESDTAPLDGEELVRQMHEQGINLRYLGRIATLSQEISHLQLLAKLEMIVRAARRELDACLQENSLPTLGSQVDVASILVRFLNGLLGCKALGIDVSEEALAVADETVQLIQHERTSPDAKHRRWNGKIKSIRRVRFADGSRSSDDPLDAVNLWQTIRNDVKHKYRFVLPVTLHLNHAQKLCFLRALCRRTGISIHTRDYDFNEMEPFSVDDMLDIKPRVKRIELVFIDVELQMQHAEAAFVQGLPLMAHEYLHEASVLAGLVYGCLAPITGEATTMLAMSLHQMREFAAAAEHQQRAAIIFERCLGLDDARTARAHMNLALFLCPLGHFDAALLHCQRALYLMTLLSGGLHPDVASGYLNLASLLVRLGRTSDALTNASRAVSIFTQLFGENNPRVQTASVSFSYCSWYLEAPSEMLIV